MNHYNHSDIENFFYQNKGFARTRDLMRFGLNTYRIKELELDGYISKVKQGLYRWVEYPMSNNEDLVEVSIIVPKGVICLLSALSYYELSTYTPWEYYVALPRKYNKSNIADYPPIKVVYFSDKYYFEGINQIVINGHNIKIYDMEKTICDSIRYKEKIGIDIVKESLNEYMKRSDKNLKKLVDYSEKLRVKEKLQSYLEVL
ncbi:type IV toxin-antitoxin system AbiEi family antitoxin domain-containing protein [Terribacillus saccharophilus]|uniref:type IV toxin-antitoxin system AbiEi family antitoxin domain-containing protein n=1 Tax=Terribacillus saccharophilus TaxID=361277 RepID=UPI003D265F11